MKRPDRLHSFPKGQRVAMVVTKTPQEPSLVVRETLLGVLNQSVEHDTWVADEDPSKEDMDWYESNGIKVSTRKDSLEYHNESWPRRKKSKEGNLAYFYDNYGYENYDLVVQLDADHVPNRDYLEHILRPFSDPKVGYVAAPSVCDTNALLSWSARARMNVEAIFHGPIQSGTNDGWVPICIGSHYALRTSALKQIGGIGPELAEDYSTTLLLNAQGWRGAWVYDARAKGEGPHSFSDIIVQDYQWARSLVVIMLTIFPKVFFKLNWKQKIQFTFTQLWYPVSALVWISSVILVSTALISGRPPVTLNFVDFLIYSALPYSLVIFSYLFIRSRGFMRPEYGNSLTWENFFFELARWPWVAIASVEAVISSIMARGHAYKVTPKGKASNVQMHFIHLLPYLLTIMILLYSVVIAENTIETFGYFIFALVLAVMYMLLVILAIILHIAEIRDESKKKIHHLSNHSIHLISSTVTIIVLVFVVSVSLNRFSNIYKAEMNAKMMEVSTEILASKADTILASNQDNLASQENNEVVTDNNDEVVVSSQDIDGEYIVVEGDSLWGISEHLYGYGVGWPEIYALNTDKIQNPDMIFPGDILIVHKESVDTNSESRIGSLSNPQN